MTIERFLVGAGSSSIDLETNNLITCLHDLGLFHWFAR